jgi:hypothetical protein
VTDPRNWHTDAKRFAVTVLVVAIALYIAAQLIEAVLPILVVTGLVGAVVYVVVTVGRHRRSRW